MAADPLYELLAPHISPQSPHDSPPRPDELTSKYLSRLSALSLDDITTTEPQSLAQASHSSLLSLQSLAARSNASLVSSSAHLSQLSTTLPDLASTAKALKAGIPTLDDYTLTFSKRYSHTSTAENAVLDRRKKALLMSRNVDRLSDIMDLPSLLSSAIAVAAAQGSAGTANYAAALDLRSHIRRLHVLYGDSKLVGDIYRQCEDKMQDMASELIKTLRVQNVKFAAAMRVIGWLRRVLPDLDGGKEGMGESQEGTLGALFLVCRLATLVNMLSALEPLRDLADQEIAARKHKGKANRETSKEISTSMTWSSGQQTERYLKRYIEIFREQSFAIVSMYKSIFPSSSPTASTAAMTNPSDQQRTDENNNKSNKILFSPPSALTTFPLHLLSLLTETLQQYLPNVRDKSSRESLLTQGLYCAGSLGRLGGDFSLVIAQLSMTIEMDMEEEKEKEEEQDSSSGDAGTLEKSDKDGGEEWVQIMKKHRELAGRLELLASGVGLGFGKKG